jgi:hypothetical protein
MITNFEEIGIGGGFVFVVDLFKKAMTSVYFKINERMAVRVSVDGNLNDGIAVSKPNELVIPLNIDLL